MRSATGIDPKTIIMDLRGIKVRTEPFINFLQQVRSHLRAPIYILIRSSLDIPASLEKQGVHSLNRAPHMMLLRRLINRTITFS